MTRSTTPTSSDDASTTTASQNPPHIANDVAQLSKMAARFFMRAPQRLMPSSFMRAMARPPLYHLARSVAYGVLQRPLSTQVACSSSWRRGGTRSPSLERHEKRKPTKFKKLSPRIMSDTTWTQLLREGSPTPAMLQHGLPPTLTADDSYVSAWKKRMLMEMQALLSSFQAHLKTSHHCLDLHAHVHVRFRDQDRQGNCTVELATKQVCSSTRSVLWRTTKPHEVVAPQDLLHSLLKIGSRGWLYITNTTSSAREYPVRCTAITFNDSFQQRKVSATRAERGIFFESFTSLIDRFRSLDLYKSNVDAGIRRVIETGDMFAASTEANVLKPVDVSGVRAKCKLNDRQWKILTTIHAPVDFVQGPPGTGKSTFIVEYVKHRLQLDPDSRVLICATTNKAIDSLTEKLAVDFSDVLLAVGSKSRLGATSARFHIDARVARHSTVRAFEEQVFCSRYEALMDAYDGDSVPIRDLVNDDDGDSVAMGNLVEEIYSALRGRGLAKEPPAGRYSTLRARVLAMEPIPPSLKLEPLVQSDWIDAIDNARKAMRRKRTERTMLDAIKSYRNAVNSAAASVENAVREFILLSAQYVVCTASTVASIQDRLQRDLASCSSRGECVDFMFKHVILDEAGAMLEPDVIGTILHGCKSLLFVGDHLQLPPFTKWRHAGDFAYDVPTMKRLSDTEIVPETHNMMTTQYRMHPHIASVVSSQFYFDALTTSESTRRGRPRDPGLVFLDVGGEEAKHGTSFINSAEIATVVALVRQERLADPSRVVNVVCFHKPQVHAIRRELELDGLLDNATLCEATGLPLLDVCTVDSMQGREADVVILSCVRTSRTSIGFVVNRNRINVALSRAKHVLYIVGNETALSADVTWRAVLAHAHHHRHDRQPIKNASSPHWNQQQNTPESSVAV